MLRSSMCAFWNVNELTVTVAPLAGWKITSGPFVFDESALIVSPPYVPAATSTVAPGAAAWYARLIVLHGAACEHALPSEPDVDMNTLAPEVGQAEVEALTLADFADRLPAASTASTASV